ncbi:DUF1428 domain-containing protein [Novosphingobium pentaromativorans]|uniref:RNA signal recognition particle 4.5S RNA n=1 Tax=Novosphingobium pentaromativorans US6-1 TaxID=1088721 RepID=G6EIA6_9SPHN|nr:DUF1428 domain-containing protein [Novosphingobium pentaromativorans]AIT78734.1 RNA signal recognition particle 4.5S RNA [Novosphingobium pentaromativorans US6-1]EHJ58848.1 hypothetical protein NSU_4077 [Novosphingobium pentaromativorans US6-1]
MTYVEGFVIAVPIANKASFIAHAEEFDALFVEKGASRVVECWAEDVPHGKQTDFYRSVAARDDEAVVFSWIEWPDKATRDKGMDAVMADPRMDMNNNPVPFDGARMIFGCFTPIVDMGA